MPKVQNAIMNLKQIYQQKVAPSLMEEFNITNKMAVPRILKVIVNVGLKEAAHDKGVLQKTLEQMAMITGQKPRVTVAKKSIANFKLRQGDPVGVMVTLRGKRMDDFLTKLLNVVLPRVRDFQGVPNSAFDKSGNYTLGLSEQIVFPEIDYAKIDRVRGLEITIVVKSGSATMAKRMLELMGMPFRKERGGGTRG